MGGAQGGQPGNVNEWLQQFLLNNPAFLPMLNLQQTAGAAKQEEPSTSFDIASLINKEGDEKEKVEIRVMTPLAVKTSEEEVVSGPESGIGSGEDANTDPSPVPSESSKESTPPVGEGQQRKRKSVDAIASFLFKQKQCSLQG